MILIVLSVLDIGVERILLSRHSRKHCQN